MKSIWVCTLAAVLFGGVLATAAQADPWPDYTSQADIANYVTVTPENTSGNSWVYKLTVDSGAVDPIVGTVTGIRALAVYYTPDYTAAALLANWSVKSETKAFGYLADNPAYDVEPDGIQHEVGTATYVSAPANQVFLVHVIGTNLTYWARGGSGNVVPEPASAMMMAISSISLAGVILRRRRNS